MNKTKKTNGMVGSSQPPATKKSAGIIAFKSLVLLSVLGTSATGLLFGFEWASYRHGHLVIKDARTRGTIAELGARMEGQIKEIHVVPNQRVKKGDLLVSMRADHLEAKVKRAEAELNAKNRKIQAEQVAYHQIEKELNLEVKSQEAMMAAAEAQSEATMSEHQGDSRQFDRIYRLKKRGAVSQSEWDEILSKKDQSEARVKNSSALAKVAGTKKLQAELAIDGLEVNKAEIGILEAEVGMLQANLDSAKADLAASQILAPNDGWVIRRIIEEGGAAQVGEPIISIWYGDLWVEAWVKEADLRDIPIGSEVDLSFDAFPSAGVKGKVASLGVLTDEVIRNEQVPSDLRARFRESAMVPVRVEILNPEALPHAQPGLSVIAGVNRRGSAKQDSTVSEKKSAPSLKGKAADGRPLADL